MTQKPRLPKPKRRVASSVICRSVGIGLAVTLISLSLGGCAFGPMACGSLESRAKTLSRVLEEKHSPPLDQVKIEGWCDDETPYYGVLARVGPDLTTARQRLVDLGCRSTDRQPPPASLDFDETAAERMLCDVRTVGQVLVSLEPDGALLAKRKYKGVRGFFAPLDAD